MRTQRRENRWQHTTCTKCARISGQAVLAPVAPHGRAYARVGTAPPTTPASFRPSDGDPSRWPPDWLATLSLQLDHRIPQFARPVDQDSQPSLRSSPPLGAGRRAGFGIPATLRSSLLHIPVPSGFARPSPALPQNPAGQCRWTERYDGKRDLYFQHAA
jgi:hypothetical protein